MVMLKKGVIISTVQNGRSLSQSNLQESQLWKSHRFGAYGDDSSAQQSGDRIPPDRTASPALSSADPENRTVDRWIKESAVAGLVDPFSPSTVPQAPPSPVNKPSPEPEVQAPPVRKRYGRIRKPLGLDTSNTNPDPAVPVASPVPAAPLALQQIVSHPALPEPPTPNGIRADTSSSDANLIAFEEESGKPPIVKSFGAENHAVADDNILGNNQSNSGLSEKTVNAGVNNIAAEDEQLISYKITLSPPPIKAPYMPTEQKSSSNPDDSVFEPNWSAQIVSKAASSVTDHKLIDVSVPQRPYNERVQGESEVDTRSVRRTMKQKKPALLAGSSNTLITLYKNIELATIDILKLAQKAQGPLLLRMEIGRILIAPRPSLSDIKKKAFTVSDWSSVFPGGRRLETLFTKVWVVFCSFDGI